MGISTRLALTASLVGVLLGTNARADLRISDPYIIVDDGPAKGTYNWYGCRVDGPSNQADKTENIFSYIGDPIFTDNQQENVEFKNGTPGTYLSSTKIVYQITVPHGYGLGKIAKDLSQLRGDNIDWHSLYKENEKIIGPNPHKLRKGMKLTFTRIHHHTEISII